MLLVHVPPVVGDKVIVEPIQTCEPAVTTGLAFIVTELVVALHPVVVLVKVNAAVPAVTPVTTPALVTVAFALLLVHVPPVVGVKVIVEPIQTCEPAVTTGKAFTVTVVLALAEQP